MLPQRLRAQRLFAGVIRHQPLVPLRIPPAALRSLPARSGTLEPLPGNRSAPQTRCSRPAAISPGPPSCTSALRLPLQTGPSEIAPPSAPHASDIPVPPPLPRYTAPPSLPPPPAADAHP